MKAKVLIVDDDVQFSDMLAQQVQRMGNSVSIAHTLEEGVRKAQSVSFDVLFLDVQFPEGSGLDAMPRFQTSAFPPEIIIITGFGEPDGAQLAMESGVWDYINKGSSLGSARMSLARALQYRESRQAAQVPVALKMEGMIGAAPCFTACIDFLAQAADSPASVLLTGETGTGKELFARAIHENSQNAGGAFVVVDCAALPENLVESILFGHEKGAFTGADRPQDGLIMQADGGTLFLDEVGELPLSMQGAFLRVLQERRFRPVGGKKEVNSDFRLVAATNRSLDAMAAEGKFREDLLYRLRGLTIELPPLRNRTKDIMPLAFHHVTKLCELRGREPIGFSPDFFEVIQAHAWPGNVRELVNALEGAVALAGNEPILYAKHLPSPMRAGVARASFPERSRPQENSGDWFAMPDDLPSLKDVRDRVEKEYLERLIADSGYDIQSLCRTAGLSRARIYAILKKHGLERRA